MNDTHSRRAQVEELKFRALRCREIAARYGDPRGRPLADLAGEFEARARSIENVTRSDARAERGE